MTINNASISNNGLSLNINISTGIGSIITSAKLWTEDGFKDYSLAKDLNFKLEQINNNEIFIVTPEEVNLNNFNGIYFIEFQTNEENSDECNTCSDPLLVVITNLDQYYRCMTEFILKANFCKDNLFSKETCNDSNINKALTLNLVIEGINQALELGQFVEALDLLKTIKKLCSKCSNCKNIIKSNKCQSCNNYIY